jgi:hypothetical protein
MQPDSNQNQEIKINNAARREKTQSQVQNTTIKSAPWYEPSD